MTPEFSRTVRADTIGTTARSMSIGADAAERSALAARFGLVVIDSLSAELALTRSGDAIITTGSLKADVTQSCVGTGEPVPATIDEEFTILFRPHPQTEAEEEIELSESELDVVFYDGAMIDVGEAVAETLSLSLDAFPRAPEAETVLRDAGVISEEEAKPAGALAGLKDLLKR